MYLFSWFPTYQDGRGEVFISSSKLGNSFCVTIYSHPNSSNRALTVRQDLAEEGNVVRRRWLQWVSRKGETGAGES